MPRDMVEQLVLRSFIQYLLPPFHWYTVSLIQQDSEIPTPYQEDEFQDLILHPMLVENTLLELFYS